MTWRRLSGTVCLFFAAFFFPPQVGQCAEQNPEEFLKEFYAWYIAEVAFEVYHGDKIYAYVEKETVDKVENALYNGSLSDTIDYYTKLHNQPLHRAVVTTFVGEVAHIGNEFIAPVAIVTEYPSEYKSTTHVVVVLRETNGVLKIVKCVDIYPEA